MSKRLFHDVQTVEDFHYLTGFTMEYMFDFIDLVVMSHNKKHVYKPEVAVIDYLKGYMDEPMAVILYYYRELGKLKQQRCN